MIFRLAPADLRFLLPSPHLIGTLAHATSIGERKGNRGNRNAIENDGRDGQELGNGQCVDQHQADRKLDHVDEAPENGDVADIGAEERVLPSSIEHRNLVRLVAGRKVTDDVEVACQA